MSAIFFGSSTAGITIALINSKLNAADPTIVDGPSALYVDLIVGRHVSRTLSKISGAEDPKAIKERFAIVAFHTGTSTKNFYSPFLSYTSIRLVDDVMTSMASMNISAIIAIPKKSQIKNTKYAIIKELLLIS